MRYYRKMLFAFTAIAVIYTLLIEAIFISGYYLIQKTEYTRRLESTAKQMADYTDSRIRAVQEIHMFLRSSEFTGKYLSELQGEPDQYARLKLHAFINSVFGITPTQMQNIAITKLTDDYAILNDSTGDLAHLREKLHLDEAGLAGIVKSFEDNPNETISFLNVSGDDGSRYYIMCSRQWLGRPQPLYIFASFSENQLFDVQAADGGTFALMDKNTIVASIGAPVDKQEEQAIKQIAEDSTERRDILSSSLSGLRYVYLAQPPKFITPVFYAIVGIGILAIMASILLMLFISRRLYIPIKDVLHAIGRRIVNGDEFAYVKEAFQTLHDNIATMANSLEAYKFDAESRFFREFLLGMIPQGEIEENLQKYHYPKTDGPFVAVIIQFIETSELHVDFTHNLIIEIKQKLALTFRTLFEAKGLCIIADMTFETQVMIVNDQDTDALSELLRNTLLSFEPELGLALKAVIGSPCDQLEAIAASYQDAVMVSGFNEFSPHNAGIITRQAPNSTWRGTVYYPISLEQSLINAIIHGKTLVWQSTLDEIMMTNQNGKNASLVQLGMMLTATVNRIIDGLNEEPAAIFDDDNASFLEFHSARTYEDLQQKAMDVFGTLAARVQQRNEQSNSGIAVKMEEYVHMHYRQDISLFDLADHLNLSRNYVSSLFKTVTGCNFKDYLNEYRFTMACKIMTTQPEKKVKEVAEMVGCNTAILSRLFVRYAGMIPSHYQKQINRESETN